VGEVEGFEGGGWSMIEALYSLMAKIGITSKQDKILHFIVGFILGVVGHILTPDSIAMLAPTILFAVGKELFDRYVKKTKFDFFDMFITISGGWIGIMLYGAFT
jgi:hypothetical protein